jgi:hypothetical protein
VIDAMAVAIVGYGAIEAFIRLVWSDLHRARPMVHGSKSGSVSAYGCSSVSSSSSPPTSSAA